MHDVYAKMHARLKDDMGKGGKRGKVGPSLLKRSGETGFKTPCTDPANQPANEYGVLLAILF